MSKEFGLGEAPLTDITLILTDRFHLEPDGIIENMLIKVGIFIISTNFIIMYFEENARIPVILGRAFLATWEH